MRTVVSTCVALLLGSSPTAAQDTPLFSLGGGIAAPYGTTADTHEVGFQVGATGVFPFASRWGIEINASYVRLPPDPDVALGAIGIDPSTFDAAGGLLEGGYNWTGGVTAGLRVLLRPRRRRVVPNLAGGVGFVGTGVADQRVLYLGDSETYDGDMSENALAATFGGGVEVHLRDGVGAFGAVRYLVIFTDPERMAMMPITLGVSLRLERR
ncbi:MAG: outer membrane beta-barrel protein [Gemmatimonadota bacterium]